MPEIISGRPPPSEGVNWWNDPRLATERRQVLRLILVLALCGTVIAFLVAEVIKRQTAPPLDTTSSSPAAPPAPASAPASASSPQQAQPASPGLLESVTALIVRGDFPTASQALAAAELEIMRLRGLLAFRTGNFSEARSFFEKVAAHPAAGINDWINLASSEAALGRWPEALAAYEQARKVDPDNDYAANRYYLALLQAGEKERAARELASALQAAPAQSLSQVALASAVLALEEGKESRAREFLRAAQSLLPSDTLEALLAEPPMASVARLALEEKAQ